MNIQSNLVKPDFKHILVDTNKISFNQNIKICFQSGLSAMVKVICSCNSLCIRYVQVAPERHAHTCESGESYATAMKQ